jgi:hypothetical protein
MYKLQTKEKDGNGIYLVLLTRLKWRGFFDIELSLTSSKKLLRP